MKKNIIYIGLISSLALTAGCELLDPTEVVNPNLTQKAILETNKPMVAWLAGLERQTAIALNSHVTITEIASDNYDNTKTFFNQNLDNLVIQFKDSDINAAQFTIADLRESAVFGINTVLPADKSTTKDQEAELYFYKGYAELLAGELFAVLPAEPNGPALTSKANIELAIEDFKKALSLTTSADKKAGYNIALARAYYRIGDKANAGKFAQDAIAANANYVRFIRYDGSNGPGNTMEDAIFDRNTFDDLQPLPRLDFLDPKYHMTGSEEAPIAILKIEEAHLILAEIALADNNLASAKTSMKNTLTVVNARPKSTFNDGAEGRPQATPPSVAAGDRPDKATILVSFSPGATPRAGLVLDRQAGPITVPTVSGTSVSNLDIETLTSVDAALETLYLMRQEIFIAEGRRMIDLGIKFPISEIESLSNNNITPEQTQAFIPTFIKDKDLDGFDYNKSAGTVTIKVNVNKVLVDNKTSPAVLPFH